jgi:hypothetical protein
MLRWIKWSVVSLLALFLFGFLHYTLPDRDIVRIVGTENRRMDLAENSWFWAGADVGTGNVTQDGIITRDVRFINAVRPNGRVMVYRNEDTGWVWPPYFKIDSSNLQTEVADLVSTAENPRWVIVRHYGWRNEFFTIFPNAVSVRPATGPDEQLIPWLNIVILTLLAGFALFLWRVWAQFRERTLDPVFDSVSDTWDAVEDRAAEKRGRLTRWLDSWRGPRR